MQTPDLLILDMDERGSSHYSRLTTVQADSYLYKIKGPLIPKGKSHLQSPRQIAKPSLSSELKGNHEIGRAHV